MTKDTSLNHSATCRHLRQIRQLQLAEPNRKVPEEVEVYFSRILFLSRGTQKSTKQQLKIEKVLSKSFGSKELFDNALFNAMATDLKKTV